MILDRAGYFAVVQFLRYFLAPIYEVHEVKQVGEQEILVKWSWTMNFWWNRYLPSKFFWDPQLVFTGVTLLGYNAASGTHPAMADSFVLVCISCQTHAPCIPASSSTGASARIASQGKCLPFHAVASRLSASTSAMAILHNQSYKFAIKEAYLMAGSEACAGKWNKHVDAWDAIEHQEFPSLEGFLYAFGQMLQLNRPPPNRLTPEFQIWKRYKDWEIRRWAVASAIQCAHVHGV